MRILLNHLSLENNLSNSQASYEQCNYTKTSKNEISIKFHNFYIKKENSFIIGIIYI